MREFFLAFSEYLKSNMDRFIVKAATLTQIVIMYLKSNMDRFIDYNQFLLYSWGVYLKSNMDRFIAYQLNAIVNM